MPGITPFGHQRHLLGLPLFAYICVQAALFGVLLMHRTGVVAEKPGQIERDVTKLGGPCMAIEDYEFHKYGPLRIGKCWVHYTNPTGTSATVIFHIFHGMQWVSVMAETMTNGGPLASLNWRVIRTREIPWYNPGVT